MCARVMIAPAVSAKSCLMQWVGGKWGGGGANGLIQINFEGQWGFICNVSPLGTRGGPEGVATPLPVTARAGFRITHTHGHEVRSNGLGKRTLVRRARCFKTSLLPRRPRDQLKWRRYTGVQTDRGGYNHTGEETDRGEEGHAGVEMDMGWPAGCE